MRRRNLVWALGVIVVLAVALLAGSWVGTRFGVFRAEAGRQEEQTQLQGFLEENIEGISVGQPFPDLVLWTADGRQAFHLRELLPRGGVLFFFAAECDVCRDAVEALSTAMRTLGTSSKPVIAATGARPDRLLEGMAARGVDLPLYCDMQESLRRDHKVATARTFFVLDSAGVLTAMGTREVDPAEYMEVIASQDTPRDRQ